MSTPPSNRISPSTRGSQSASPESQHSYVRPVPSHTPPMAQPPSTKQAVKPPIVSPLPRARTPLTPRVVDDGLEENEAPLAQEAIRTAPPWLVSMVVHMLLLILLALWTLSNRQEKPIVVQLAVTEDPIEEMDDPILEPIPLDEVEPVEREPSPIEPVTEDPLAVLPDIQPVLDVDNAVRNIGNSEAATPISGRQEFERKRLRAAYGGTSETEAAVLLGLAWLKRNQLRDGSWSLGGPYANGVAGFENKTAATAMALLAFQGNGNTHQKGKYSREVAKGLKVLLDRLDADGRFYHEGPRNHTLYAQAQATIALCELYAMSEDESLRKAAQSTIDYAVKHQASEGGWRYTPGSGTDTSVTGWFVMALQSGLMAGLEVPSPALEKIMKYLDSVAKEDGSRYAYQPYQGERVSMTAEALLCRQYLGWKHDDPRLVAGIKYLNANPLDYDADENVYYWYYATQAIHHMEGKAWDRWNKVMRREVPARQVKAGPERGSWSPANDRWGSHAGRLYTTCLSIYILEVYYRHLPIYSYRKK